MKLASIETIVDIQPIPNSDFICLGKVLGWQSVIRKNEYQVGDRVVFVPIDTVLPDTEWSAFLKDKVDPTKPIRVRTSKIRGVVSQGIIFPMSILPEGEYAKGQDVGELIGITKYEQPAPTNLDAIGSFPSVYMSITDEDNLRSNPDAYEELRNCDGNVEMTMKIDGCLSGNSKILTEEGYKEISEIVDNKLHLSVASFNVDTKEIEYKPIKNWYNHGDTSIWMNIETVDGDILTVTPNHLFWLPELHCYRMASELTESDIILHKK